MKKRFALTLVAALALSPCAAKEPITIAVLDFDYADTSGEPQDQTAIHRAQLETFGARIRDALSASGVYRVVAVDCSARPCTAKDYAPQELFALARRGGARLMLFGGVHKMSTLVQWARVELVDVEQDRLVDDRHLSFRGDTDEAWRRAANFVVEKLVERPAIEESRK
jgi:hypothetical protein